MARSTFRPRSDGPSLYPIVVSFVITCFVLTWLSDLAYWATASFLWETMSVWLLTIGLSGFVLAIIAGVVDLVRRRTILETGKTWLVIPGQAIAVGLSIVNAFVHSRDGYTAVVPQGLALSSLVVVILLFTTVVSRTGAGQAQVGEVA